MSKKKTVTVSREALRVVLDYLHDAEAASYEQHIAEYPDDKESHVYTHVLKLEENITDADDGAAIIDRMREAGRIEVIDMRGPLPPPRKL